MASVFIASKYNESVKNPVGLRFSSSIDCVLEPSWPPRREHIHINYIYLPGGGKLHKKITQNLSSIHVVQIRCKLETGRPLLWLLPFSSCLISYRVSHSSCSCWRQPAILEWECLTLQIVSSQRILTCKIVHNANWDFASHLWHISIMYIVLKTWIWMYACRQSIISNNNCLSIE